MSDEVRQVKVPLSEEDLRSFTAGEAVELTGTILVGRDQAHLRLCEALDRGEELPLDIRGETIYYMGPAPTPPGKVIGSCGPTTAYRMDPFAPRLLDLGLKGMIGKGPRAKEVLDGVVRNGAVYFYAYGGCGALYAQRITSSECVAYEDLGPEAIYRLRVEKFPLVVAADCRGGSVY
ncbi:MAG: FumA C-terminus/TtdB family hydratase beta subunit [Spirochaetales bacterium]|nr:FumA C-terminus/TtdB family hydratase beta subunit [Spirochaetales bacterium]